MLFVINVLSNCWSKFLLNFFLHKHSRVNAGKLIFYLPFNETFPFYSSVYKFSVFVPKTFHFCPYYIPINYTMTALAYVFWANHVQYSLVHRAIVQPTHVITTFRSSWLRYWVYIIGEVTVIGFAIKNQIMSPALFVFLIQIVQVDVYLFFHAEQLFNVSDSRNFSSTFS